MASTTSALSSLAAVPRLDSFAEMVDPEDEASGPQRGLPQHVHKYLAAHQACLSGSSFEKCIPTNNTTVGARARSYATAAVIVDGTLWRTSLQRSVG